MDNTTGQIPSPYFLLELVPINNGEEMPPSPVSCELLLFIYALLKKRKFLFGAPCIWCTLCFHVTIADNLGKNKHINKANEVFIW